MIDKPTREFILTHRHDDVRSLALRATRYPDVDLRQAVTQIEGWQLATRKLPTWASTEGMIYPVRLSMEQCSSEQTARYKASLACGERLADLTGGFGIDCSYMAERFTQTTYIERDERLCQIACHNFALLGKSISVHHGECEQLLEKLPQQDWIFIDPARRSSTGKKVAALSDCEPDVCKLEAVLLSKSHHIMIKCSPMLDISQALRQLTSVREVHVVSVGNECKELLFILSRQEPKEAAPIRVCSVNLRDTYTQIFSHTFEEESSATSRYTETLCQYLYEPNSSLMKAGCYNTLSARFELGKLHPNTHLYTSDTFHPDFPGRIFKVRDTVGFNKSELRALTCSIKNANLAVRNFPEQAEALRKRLKLADGGDHYLFATTLADNRKVIVVGEKIL